MIKINDSLIVFTSDSKDVLSCDVYMLVNQKFAFLIDTGNEKKLYDEIMKYLFDEKLTLIGIAISHFHIDHIGNCKYFDKPKIYCSRYTGKYISNEHLVEVEDKNIISLADKEFEIVKVQSSHSKGELVIIDHFLKVIFVGDLFAPAYKKECCCYLKSQMTEAFNLFSKYRDYSFYDGHSGIIPRIKLERILSAITKSKNEIIVL